MSFFSVCVKYLGMYILNILFPYNTCIKLQKKKFAGTFKVTFDVFQRLFKLCRQHHHTEMVNLKTRIIKWNNYLIVCCIPSRGVQRKCGQPTSAMSYSGASQFVVIMKASSAITVMSKACRHPRPPTVLIPYWERNLWKSLYAVRMSTESG